MSVAACGGLIYIIGGNTMAGNDESERTHLDAVDVYDPGSGEWSPGPPFPYAVQGTNAISVDERVYSFCGHRQGVPEAEFYQRDTHVLGPRGPHEAAPPPAATPLARAWPQPGPRSGPLPRGRWPVELPW